MLKTTGETWKLFMADPLFWPSEAYLDDEVIYIDGVRHVDGVVVEDLPDACTVEVECGDVTVGVPVKRKVDLIEYFERWQREEAFVSFVVRARPCTLDAVKAAIREAGGVVA